MAALSLVITHSRAPITTTTPATGVDRKPLAGALSAHIPSCIETSIEIGQSGRRGISPIVELEEDVRVISNLVDVANDQIHIGLPVEVVYDDVTPEVSLACFRPTKA